MMTPAQLDSLSRTHRRATTGKSASREDVEPTPGTTADLLMFAALKHG